jgi:hypothetical protein
LLLQRHRQEGGRVQLAGCSGGGGGGGGGWLLRRRGGAARLLLRAPTTRGELRLAALARQLRWLGGRCSVSAAG